MIAIPKNTPLQFVIILEERTTLLKEVVLMTVISLHKQFADWIDRWLNTFPLRSLQQSAEFSVCSYVPNYLNGKSCLKFSR